LDLSHLRSVTVPAAEVAGRRRGRVDVVDELLDEGGGLVGEGLAVLDCEPAAAGGVQTLPGRLAALGRLDLTGMAA